MSSLRNAVKRVTHKERSQPQARAHLGILEKHKDYKVRAKDFHRKQDRLNQMRLQASMRNPDEFYFGMQHSHVVDGHHRKTMQAQERERADEIGPNAVRIMKDQDLSYLRMQKQLDTAKINKLQANLHFLEKEHGGHDHDDDNDDNYDEEKDNSKKRKGKRKHTIFVDTQDEANTFDVATHFGTVPQLANRAFNRPRIETIRQSALAPVAAVTKRANSKDSNSNKNNNKDIDDDDQHILTLTEQQLQLEHKLQQKMARTIQKARSAAYSEMETRLERVATLERAEAHVTTEKLLAAKGRKRKIKEAEGGQPAQYKWRRKRQR